MKQLSNLRVRLILWTVMLEAVLLVIFAFIFVLALQRSQNQQFDETLRLSAAQMNAVVDVALDEDASYYQVPTEDTAALQARGVLVWILTPEGEIGATIGTAADIPLPHPLPEPGVLTDIMLVNSEPARFLRIPLQENSRVLGTLVLAISITSGQQFIGQVLLNLGIVLPVVLGLSTAGGLFLANRALSPVKAMTMTARQISAADLSKRIPIRVPDDEMGQLGMTFNAMLARLEDAFQRERQLTSDVSHELRTPLGMLKTQVSLARSRPREGGELLRMIVDMEGDIDRMTHLIEQMLTLARIEQLESGPFLPVDVAALLNGVVGTFTTEAHAKAITLSCDIPSYIDFKLSGDEDRLRQVFINLIENAIKYADAGGKVHVQLQRLWDQITIKISNTGNVILPEHLPHLFERFYRADDSRTRSTGGFGLGLAISKAIVDAHGGTIMVDSGVGAGTQIVVMLPIS